MLSANEAKKWNADKIYICAGSAEEINKELYESDPRDFQLKFDLR